MSDEGDYQRLRVDDFLNKFNQNKLRNGVNSVALVHRQKLIGCKLLKRLVPAAGFERVSACRRDGSLRRIRVRRPAGPAVADRIVEVRLAFSTRKPKAHRPPRE